MAGWLAILQEAGGNGVAVALAFALVKVLEHTYLHKRNSHAPSVLRETEREALYGMRGDVAHLRQQHDVKDPETGAPLWYFPRAPFQELLREIRNLVSRIDRLIEKAPRSETR